MRLTALLIAASLAAAGCSANRRLPFTPLQLSLVPGAEVLSQDTPVRGASINAFYGVQQDVIGLDVGAFNQVGVLNFNKSGLLPFLPVFNFGF